MVALPGHLVSVFGQLELGVEHDAGVVDEDVEMRFGCKERGVIIDNWRGTVAKYGS